MTWIFFVWAEQNYSGMLIRLAHLPWTDSLSKLPRFLRQLRRPIPWWRRHFFHHCTTGEEVIIQIGQDGFSSGQAWPPLWAWSHSGLRNTCNKKNKKEHVIMLVRRWGIGLLRAENLEWLLRLFLFLVPATKLERSVYKINMMSSSAMAPYFNLKTRQNEAVMTWVWIEDNGRISWVGGVQ